MTLLGTDISDDTLRACSTGLAHVYHVIPLHVSKELVILANSRSLSPRSCFELRNHLRAWSSDDSILLPRLEFKRVPYRELQEALEFHYPITETMRNGGITVSPSPIPYVVDRSSLDLCRLILRSDISRIQIVPGKYRATVDIEFSKCRPQRYEINAELVRRMSWFLRTVLAEGDQLEKNPAIIGTSYLGRMYDIEMEWSEGPHGERFVLTAIDMGKCAGKESLEDKKREVLRRIESKEGNYSFQTHRYSNLDPIDHLRWCGECVMRTRPILEATLSPSKLRKVKAAIRIAFDSFDWEHGSIDQLRELESNINFSSDIEVDFGYDMPTDLHCALLAIKDLVTEAFESASGAAPDWFSSHGNASHAILASGLHHGDEVSDLNGGSHLENEWQFSRLAERIRNSLSR